MLACVRFAREHSLAVSMRGGGHNIAGLALAEGGLLIDLSLMRGVFVDPAARIARAQAGCLLGDVDRETQLHGLAAVLGFVSATGVAGLTLGGGFGYVSRRFGWTSDNVRSMDLVTADGRLVRASENEHPDLFWGLRGGGGNFGVVTAIDFELHPLGPEIVGGPVAWRAESAPEVLEAFRKHANDAPPELSLVAVMRKAPPAPWLSTRARTDSRSSCCSRATRGSSRRARSSWRRSRRSASRSATCCSAGRTSRCRACSTRPSRRAAATTGSRSTCPGSSPSCCAKQREHAERILSPHSAVIVFQLGGAIANRRVDHSAVGNRDAAAVLNITASWEKPEDDAANLEWARSSWRDMKRFSTGGTYVNFLTEEETGERIAAAYGKNLSRLAEIKARWDPDNVFRTNKNIAPSGRG